MDKLKGRLGSLFPSSRESGSPFISLDYDWDKNRLTIYVVDIKAAPSKKDAESRAEFIFHSIRKCLQIDPDTGKSYSKESSSLYIFFIHNAFQRGDIHSIKQELDNATEIYSSISYGERGIACKGALVSSEIFCTEIGNSSRIPQ